MIGVVSLVSLVGIRRRLILRITQIVAEIRKTLLHTMFYDDDGPNVW